MKTFKQFKVQLDEAKGKEHFNVYETILAIAGPNDTTYPEAMEAAKDAQIKIRYIPFSKTIKTSKGPVPDVKELERGRTKTTVNIKKGETIIVAEGGEGYFANRVVGYDKDLKVFWNLSLRLFEYHVGIK